MWFWIRMSNDAYKAVSPWGSCISRIKRTAASQTVLLRTLQCNPAFFLLLFLTKKLTCFLILFSTVGNTWLLIFWILIARLIIKKNMYASKVNTRNFGNCYKSYSLYIQNDTNDWDNVFFFNVYFSYSMFFYIVEAYVFLSPILNIVLSVSRVWGCHPTACHEHRIVNVLSLVLSLAGFQCCYRVASSLIGFRLAVTPVLLWS